MSNYEIIITDLLKNGKFSFTREKTYEDLKEGKFRFDFYVFDVHGGPALLEVDGEQHFYPNKKFFKSRTEFLHQQNNDRRKNSYCLANGIPLYRVPYWEINSLTIDEIFTEKHRVRSK